MISPSLRRHATWLVLAASLALNLWFVTTHGGWTSDLGGDPDEAAHAVTSLMLRDYLADGLGQPPMAFAREYYEVFPKVALGHYPPGYYLLAGVWLLAFPSIHALLVLQAVLAAVVSAQVYRAASKLAGIPAAAVAGMVMSMLPVSLQHVHLVMSDLLLVALVLAAALLWRDYLSRPTLVRALGFGLVTAAAVLTKGSAMGLCLIPPVSTLLTRRWELLKKLSWWLCGLPVALLAGPWMLYSAPITAEGMLHIPLSKFIPEAITYYVTIFPHVLGWLLTAVCAVGVLRLLLLAVQRPREASAGALAAALCGVLAGMVAIVLAVPAGLTERYLLPVLPALLIGVAAVVEWATRDRPALRWPALLAMVAGCFWLPPLPEKEVHGFTTAVAKSGVPTPQPEQAAKTVSWLVTSDPRGEGAIIAAAAFACETRSPSPLRVLRGSKVLSTSDWMGRGYTLTAKTEEEMLALLDKENITRVFVDLSVPEPQRPAHLQLLLSAMQSGDQRWKPSFEEPVTRDARKKGTLLVYQRS